MCQSEVAASAVEHHLPDYQGRDLIFSIPVESKWVPELETLVSFHVEIEHRMQLDMLNMFSCKFYVIHKIFLYSISD